MKKLCIIELKKKLIINKFRWLSVEREMMRLKHLCCLHEFCLYKKNPFLTHCHLPWEKLHIIFLLQNKCFIILENLNVMFFLALVTHWMMSSWCQTMWWYRGSWKLYLHSFMHFIKWSVFLFWWLLALNKSTILRCSECVRNKTLKIFSVNELCCIWILFNLSILFYS